MFFKRKNKIGSIDNSRLDILTSSKDNNIYKQVCNTDKGLNECDSIAKIRKWQEELDNIESIGLDDITLKYISIPKCEFNFENLKNTFQIVNCLNESFKVRAEEYNTMLDFLQALGKDLDNYNNKEQLKENLQKVIKEEKDKLGIK